MQHAALSGFDPATLARTFGPAAFAKGFQYAQQQAVVHAEWDPSEGALRGLVRGHGGNFYATAAFFSQTSGLPPEFELAECSCPVEFDCKHAVALILAAAAMAPAATPHSAGVVLVRRAGRQQPHPGGQLGLHVEHELTRGHQLLGQEVADPAGALDPPGPPPPPPPPFPHPPPL